MGFCSYCYQYAGSSYGRSNECYGWDEARACSGISGPDDPVLKERKRRYNADKAKNLRAEAKKIRAQAEQSAKALEREALSYQQRS